MREFFELYDMLIEGISSDAVVTDTLMGECWTAVKTAEHFGMAMTTPVDTVPGMLGRTLEGMPLKELAAAAKSWNLTEAGFGMAAINAYYNTAARMDALGAYEPFEKYCTDGLTLTGKTIGIVGHLNMPGSVRTQAKQIYILERDPRPGDYPDSACDFLIPHMMRRLVGNDYRFLMPASMLGGGVFLLVVDNVSRNLTTSGIPIGILTAFIGAPFFLWLITGKGDHYGH